MSGSPTDDLPEPGYVASALQPALALPSLAPQRERLERLLADYARTRSEAARAVVVALVGATGAGKSTLLNALAGTRVAPEGVDRPTSREAVVYAPEDADVAPLREARTRVERYPVRESALWSGQVFVDTPDLNSVEPLHREIARAALEKADVALLVLHRGSVAEAAQARFLDEFARRRRLALVINFADELGQGAQAELRAQARRLLAAQWETSPEAIPCFVVSAREAQRGVDVTGELPQLVAWLQSLAGETAARSIRRTNAGAILESLRRAVLPALSEAEAAQREVEASLHAGRAQAHATLETDLDARLRAAQTHLRDEARRQAASLGWGPLAVALRISGVGSGGLAAGTLLLGRSLPIGLAVAGAGAAIERIARHARSRDVEGAWVADTEDDDGTAARAARLWVGGARTAALRRGFDAGTLGLPAVDEVRARLAAARLESWRYAVGTGLFEAVSRWWRWARVLLFLPLNLAVFALAVDAGIRVVRGYLEGRYLEAAYYLNAAAIAALWAAVGAGAVGVTLRGAVARARARALAHFAERLAGVEGELVQSVETARAPFERAAAAIKT